MMTRREFAGGALAMLATGWTPRVGGETLDERLSRWQRETDLVSADAYNAYMKDGDTRGLVSLENLEAGFDRVLEEIRATTVCAVPAVWSVYNMGYVVKTQKSLFSIDLVHRRALELVPTLNFALITHNHGDHYQLPFYKAMNRAGKTVVSNFLDNYGAADWKKGGDDWYAAGGYVRGKKTFKVRDVEIHTSLVDHNAYLVDFTTAFELRIGKWKMYHSGDCANAAKLGTIWGKPDLWTFFPGCGIDVAAAVKKVGAKRTVFGHLWELGHRTGRLTTPLVNAARARAASAGVTAEVPMWGDRIS